MSQSAAVPDPLERLRDERLQIDQLFDSFARRQQNPGHSAAETARLSAWICTLLRVHDDLETRVLEPALTARLVAGGHGHPALARAAARRVAVREAMDRVEASPRGPDHWAEMATLARQARAWFRTEEREVFALANALAGGTALDLAALDEQLGRRQEDLLSAGRGAQR